MMRILGISAAALSVFVLVGCEDPARRVAYEGEYFRTKVTKVDKQRDVFVVNVKGVSKTEAGARQAAYHRGVSYCLLHFGSSEIIWEQNPLDEEIALQVSKDEFNVQGRCPQAQEI